MSRTYRNEVRHPYSKESTDNRRMTNRKWRRQGKRLLDQAAPQKGTSGWLTH